MPGAFYDMAVEFAVVAQRGGAMGADIACGIVSFVYQIYRERAFALDFIFRRLSRLDFGGGTDTYAFAHF
jgi:hypothetical protein